MDWLLAFFSGIILFTAGIAVCLLWIIILAAGLIELWDFVFKTGEGENDA